MADNFDMKQFLFENKLGSYARNTVVENQEEGYMGTQYGSSEDMAVDMVKKGITERYQPGDMWSPNFDYKGMLKAAANLSVSSPEELMQNISDSFEDVNYHRENSHLQDAIEAKKENDNDAIKFHLALFKDELKKTIKNLKETQIFEREKIEEGEAAYEYEKGKAAGEKEEKAKLTKEDLGKDIEDAEAEKMMDFLYEKDKVKEGLPVEDPRVEQIIQTLKDLDVDGETMEYIIKSVGMDDQMANQLVHNKAELDEVLSSDAYARMDGLADPLALADFKDNAYYVIASLREDGFDDEDILEFLKDHLNIAFN